MKRFSDHTELEGIHILEALAQTDKPATLKEITFVLTEGGPVDTKSARYDYVRRLMSDLTEAGLVDKEKSGRSYQYSMTEAGYDVLIENEGAEEEETSSRSPSPGYVESLESTSPAGHKVPDEAQRNADAVGEAIHEKINKARHSEEDSDTSDRTTEDEPSNEIDDLLAEAEGDGANFDVPDKPEPTPQKEQVETSEGKHVERERVEWPKYYQEIVPDAPETTRKLWNRRPDGTPSCPHMGQVVSRDPVADGLVDEDGQPTHPRAEKIRTECPHCGSIRVSGLNADGELKLHLHEITERDVAATMKDPFVRYQDGSLFWFDPTEDNEDEA